MQMAAVPDIDPQETLEWLEALDEADRQALRAHGFSDEDVWDIGGITAFFALSNRMAHLIAMRPNDEFYLLGRVPPPSKSAKTPKP